MNEYLKSLGFLADCGVMIQMISYGKYDVYGFYKCNKLTVDLTNKTISSRYGKFDEIVDFMPLEEQLLYINIEWWEQSKERWSGWDKMSPAWKEVEKLIEERKHENV